VDETVKVLTVYISPKYECLNQ